MTDDPTGALRPRKFNFFSMVQSLTLWRQIHRHQICQGRTPIPGTMTTGSGGIHQETADLLGLGEAHGSGSPELISGTSTCLRGKLSMPFSEGKLLPCLVMVNYNSLQLSRRVSSRSF